MAQALLNESWRDLMESELTSRREFFRLIQAEFRESPGLRLTRAQVARLWGLDPKSCDEVLAALTEAGVLREAGDAFVRAEKESGPSAPPVLSRHPRPYRPTE